MRRLLRSLERARYPEGNGVPLIVSIDYSGEDDSRREAEKFEWSHGPLRIIARRENLGLKDHVLACGDLVSEHDAVIVLEDDLLVSPSFYEYARQACDFYAWDDRVACVSLYSRVYQVFADVRFIPLKDRFDTFFMKVPCSWGQMWTRRQWSLFRNYLSEHPTVTGGDLVPRGVHSWPDSSWMKHFYGYLTATDRLVVYPYHSMTTNMGEPGEHFERRKTCMQAPLVGQMDSFCFATPDNTAAVYDYAYELRGEKLDFLTDGESLELDLYGIKQLDRVRSEWLVSVKPCIRPERTFGHDLRPPENNIFHAIRGQTYSLGRTRDFQQSDVCERLMEIEEARLPEVARRARRRAAQKVKETKSYKLGSSLLAPARCLRNLISTNDQKGD
jgi:hypothetical protein